MARMSRTAAFVATGALAATFGLSAVAPALADGPEEPPEALATEIMAQPWPAYTEGDGPDTDIYVIKLLLADQGHYEFPADGAPEEFGPDLTDAVVAFQDAHDLPDNGDVAEEEWSRLLQLYFPRSGGSYDYYGPGDSGEVVEAIQYMLVHEYDKDLGDAGIDGQYGPATEAAVAEFQSETCTDDGETCLDEDGLVGLYTWRALVTGGI